MVVHRVTDDLLLAEQAILDALDEIGGDAKAETWVAAAAETAN